MDDRLYTFLSRGLLAEEALDAAGRPRRVSVDVTTAGISEALSFELFDPEMLERAQLMSLVYAAIAAFEHSVRKFVSRVLLDEFAEDWWEKGVSRKIREFAESRRDDEEKTKWHGVRGEDLLSYTELGHLPNIMQQNLQLFEPYVRRLDWATSIFGTIERSRNVIMHSGTLELSLIHI